MVMTGPHIFLNIDPIMAKPAPIESSRSGLSIRVGFVKIGAILRNYGENKNEYFRQFAVCPTYFYGLQKV